jgi:DNA-directed RNA polymerase subunit RPC12/RpoP
MTWAYCSKCEAALKEPTVEQALRSEYNCPQCGHNNFPNKSMVDVVIEIHERLCLVESRELSNLVLAESVELSLLPNEARWLKALVQNPVYSNETQEDADFRASLFHKLGDLRS